MKFINVGRMLLECGCVLFEVVDKFIIDVEVLLCGWEIYLMIVIEVLVFILDLFLLIEKLVIKFNMQLLIIIEVLVGVWEWLEQGWVDIVVVLDMYFCFFLEINLCKFYLVFNVYVVVLDYLIYQELELFLEVICVKYCGVVVVDIVCEWFVFIVQLLDKQLCLMVSIIEDKCQVLLVGLGVVIMFYLLVEKDIVEGCLWVVSLEYINEIDIIMVW